ncbi:unnamed protein product [Prunus brigantina]
MCFQDVSIHAELMIYHLQRLVGLNFASDGNILHRET